MRHKGHIRLCTARNLTGELNTNRKFTHLQPFLQNACNSVIYYPELWAFKDFLLQYIALCVVPLVFFAVTESIFELFTTWLDKIKTRALSKHLPPHMLERVWNRAIPSDKSFQGICVIMEMYYLGPQCWDICTFISTMQESHTACDAQ